MPGRRNVRLEMGTQSCAGLALLALSASSSSIAFLMSSKLFAVGFFFCADETYSLG